MVATSGGALTETERVGLFMPKANFKYILATLLTDYAPLDVVVNVDNTIFEVSRPHIFTGLFLLPRATCA